MTRLTIKRYAGGGDVDLSALFALVPDEIVLAVAGRDLALFDGSQCLVGWTLREHLAALQGVPAENIGLYPVPSLVSEELGGEVEDWRAVYLRVQFAEDQPPIEAAWTNRVLQAAENVDAPKLVLPADVYDTLELSAYAFDGIGASSYFEDDMFSPRALSNGFTGEVPAPVCAVGHAAFSALPGDWWKLITESTINANDVAVQAINARKGNASDAKVTFAEWARELNVVRGDS